MINVYEGPHEGHTVMKLTDGSTVGGLGDVTDHIDLCGLQNRLVIVNNGDGTKLSINPNHIVYARYTEPKEDNDGSAPGS